MFHQGPSDSDLAGFGLSASDWEEEPVYAWPENEQAARLLERVANQWRVGPGGPISLDYGVIFAFMDRQGIANEDQLRLMDQIGVMERVALREILKG